MTLFMAFNILEMLMVLWQNVLRLLVIIGSHLSLLGTNYRNFLCLLMTICLLCLRIIIVLHLLSPMVLIHNFH